MYDSMVPVELLMVKRSILFQACPHVTKNAHGTITVVDLRNWHQFGDSHGDSLIVNIPLLGFDMLKYQ